MCGSLKSQQTCSNLISRHIRCLNRSRASKGRSNKEAEELYVTYYNINVCPSFFKRRWLSVFIFVCDMVLLLLFFLVHFFFASDITVHRRRRVGQRKVQFNFIPIAISNETFLFWIVYSLSLGDIKFDVLWINEYECHERLPYRREDIVHSSRNRFNTTYRSLCLLW